MRDGELGFAPEFGRNPVSLSLIFTVAFKSASTLPL